MVKKLIFTFTILSFVATGIKSQEPDDTLVYLITCSPGTATYSIYGHSALRVVIPSSGYDMVYNWGVFDFNTPHFVWKFAGGRLNYMLGVYPYDLFLRDYFMERRSVYSQRVNLESSEIRHLMYLLEENLKPENIYYRYDFFYDNCSTRIRDIFEKIFSDRLVYPVEEKKDMPTFRDKINEYQRYYPWLKAGVDLLLGLPADRKASFRDLMFLPEYLQRNLSASMIKRGDRSEPLLQDTETIIEFEPINVKNPFYSSPLFVLGLILIIIILISTRFRNLTYIKYFDILIFTIFSILSLFLLFFNFITEHAETKMNINFIWINPFIIVCLICLSLNKQCTIWFRLVFWLAVLYIIGVIIFASNIYGTFIPAALILALRSSVYSDFKWNPFGLKNSEIKR